MGSFSSPILSIGPKGQVRYRGFARKKIPFAAAILTSPPWLDLQSCLLSCSCSSSCSSLPRPFHPTQILRDRSDIESDPKGQVRYPGFARKKIPFCRCYSDQSLLLDLQSCSCSSSLLPPRPFHPINYQGRSSTIPPGNSSYGTSMWSFSSPILSGKKWKKTLPVFATLNKTS